MFKLFHMIFSRLSSLVLLLSFFLLMLPTVFAQVKLYDYVIKGALVFDGEFLKGFRKDVAIAHGKIAKIGEVDSGEANLRINGRGLVLTPGFIDAHTHSDFNPIVYPQLTNKILQGVTTEIVGNCGMSAAPVLGRHREQIHGIWAREGVRLPKEIPWGSFKEYRETLQSAKMATHFAALVGHGNIRTAVMGFAKRPASAGEIEAMKKILAQAMREGARGISFGLVYLPGIFAQREELVALCHEAARHRGICAFHLRSEADRLPEAVREAIAVGREAQAPIQISHLKAAGAKNWDKIGQAFQFIETARRGGMKIAADVYPYTASHAELGVILPDRLYQREDRAAYFKNPLKRDEVLNGLRDYFKKRGTRWDSVAIAATPHKRYQKYQGKTIKEVVRKEKKEPEQFLVEILAGTNFETSAFFFSQSEDVVREVLKKPYVSIGSDSIADGSGRPHPRAYGSFPRIFRKYVREERLIAFGDAVRKMTSLAAGQFGLKDRGVIREGAVADLVLIDAGNFEDLADYEHPKIESRGVRWVFVAGRPVVKEGKVTSERPGRLL